ncbi:hypothetical protein HGRIS_001187 [Hohenbuehelia grisea]|uniref:F-box domain-containing protein n=1 Tax=Hohenbuehelia grisea TaxID=104357 RepID=A0ABR3JQR2_9AGAR
MGFVSRSWQGISFGVLYSRSVDEYILPRIPTCDDDSSVYLTQQLALMIIPFLCLNPSAISPVTSLVITLRSTQIATAWRILRLFQACDFRALHEVSIMVISDFAMPAPSFSEVLWAIVTLVRSRRCITLQVSWEIFACYTVDFTSTPVPSGSKEDTGGTTDHTLVCCDNVHDADGDERSPDALTEHNGIALAIPQSKWFEYVDPIDTQRLHSLDVQLQHPKDITSLLHLLSSTSSLNSLKLSMDADKRGMCRLHEIKPQLCFRLPSSLSKLETTSEIMQHFLRHTVTTHLQVFNLQINHFVDAWRARKVIVSISDLPQRQISLRFKICLPTFSLRAVIPKRVVTNVAHIHLHVATYSNQANSATLRLITEIPHVLRRLPVVSKLSFCVPFADSITSETYALLCALEADFPNTEFALCKKGCTET